MTPVTIDTTLLDAPDTSVPEKRKLANVFDRMRDVRGICRQVFGIPDYDRYLAHAGTRHPGRPVLSRREYFAQAIDRKYSKSGPRCC